VPVRHTSRGQLDEEYLMTTVSPSATLDLPAELEAHHADVIRATLPVIAQHIDDITALFYEKLFAAHPDLLAGLFNRGNQAQGAQQRALAASIATFANSEPTASKRAAGSIVRTSSSALS
jgi:hemoglobin-like flavoprotein